MLTAENTPFLVLVSSNQPTEVIMKQASKLAVLIALTVFAIGLAEAGNNNNGDIDIDVDANGGSSSLGNFNQFGGDGGNATAIQNQIQSSKSSVKNSGNSKSVSVAGGGNAKQSMSYTEVRQHRAAPDVGIGYAAPSANCANTHGFGLSVPGGAGTLGTSNPDKGCERREWTRTLYIQGETVMALRISCSDPVVADANPLDCDAVKQVRPGTKQKSWIKPVPAVTAGRK
jgi:hypothetical protein